MPRTKLSSKRDGILLDIGCGPYKRGPHWVGMDNRKLPGVDIVHDLEKIPWPIKSYSVITLIANHVLEHLKPWLTVDIFNEMWRVCKPEGQLVVGVPYGVNDLYVQDPTHCNPFNERTFQYFDPRPEQFGWVEEKVKGVWKVKTEGAKNILYPYYEAKPWKINLMYWQSNGSMEVVMEKRR